MSTLANSTIEGKIFDATGSIFVERDGKNIELKVNDPIYEADIIFTGPDGTADILYRDGTKSRIAPNTRFTLTDYEFGAGDDGTNFLIDIAHGTIRNVTGEIVKLNPDGFNMVTPRATVGIRGTESFHSVGEVETHMTIYISQGSIMLVRSHDGAAVGLNTPLQVTRFEADMPPNQPMVLSPTQALQLLQSIAPSLSGDLPQNAREQGDWKPVDISLMERIESDAAEEASLGNTSQDYVSSSSTKAATVVLGEDVDISALLELFDKAGLFLEIILESDLSEDLEELKSLAESTLTDIDKPELGDTTGQSSQGSNDLEFVFTKYSGGPITIGGVTYSLEELAKTTKNITLTGFEFSSPDLVTGNANVDYAIGASTFNNLSSDIESQATSEEENTLHFATGSGNDTFLFGMAKINGQIVETTFNDYTRFTDTSSQKFSAAANHVDISTNAGNDIFHANYAAPTSPDVFELSLYESNIDMGAGNDAVYLYDGAMKSSIDLGSGDDILEVQGIFFDDMTVRGTGNNNIDIETDYFVYNSTFEFGAGNDDLYIKNGIINYNAGKSLIGLGDGTNKLTVGGLSFESIMVTGTGNNDIDIESGVYNSTFTLGAGNDDLYIKSGMTGDYNSAEPAINLGDGTNVLTIDGLASQVIIKTGTNDDTLTLGGGVNSSTIDLGAGTDKLVVNGSDFFNATVTGTGNNDIDIEVDTQLGQSTFALGSGDDDLYIKSDMIGDLSSAEPTINLGDGTNVLTIGGELRNATVNTGTGDDTLNLNGGAYHSTIDLGAGTNVLTLDGELGNATVKTGTDDNTLNLNGGAYFANIDLGAGTNNLVVKGSNCNSATVTGTGNNDIDIEVENGTNHSTFTLGSGNDDLYIKNSISGLPYSTEPTIDLGNGTNVLTIGGVANQAIIKTGTGDDALNLNGGVTNSTIDLGDGTNKLVVNGSNFDFMTVTGTGNNDIDIETESPVNNSTFTLGSGNDDLYIKSGMIGNLSSAEPTINLGDGTNVLTIDGNLTNATIKAGTGDDTLNLNDGAYTSTIDLGVGTNKLTIGGVANQAIIKTGTGDDALNLNGGVTNSTIDLGDGTNKLVVNGSNFDFMTVTGTGNNDIDIETESAVNYSTFTLGLGNDDLYIKSGLIGDYSPSNPLGTPTIDLGAGTNTLTFGDNTQKLDAPAFVENSYIKGAGDNTIEFKEVKFINSRVELGDGDDTLAFWQGIGNTSIQLGEGTNTVNLYSITDFSTIESAANSINTIFFNENITLMRNTNINLGDGDDTIYFQSAETTQLVESTINMGAGNNKIYSNLVNTVLEANTGSNTFNLTNSDSSTYLTANSASDGNSFFNVYSTTLGKVEISSGSGDDVLTFHNALTLHGVAVPSNAVVEANLGDGTNTINFDANWTGYAIKTLNTSGTNIINFAENTTITGIVDASDALSKSSAGIITLSSDDTINAGSSNLADYETNFDIGSTFNNMSINTAAGNDAVYIGTYNIQNNDLQIALDASGDSGNDILTIGTIKFEGSSNNLAIGLGGGDDQVNIKHILGENTVTIDNSLGLNEYSITGKKTINIDHSEANLVIDLSRFSGVDTDIDLESFKSLDLDLGIGTHDISIINGGYGGIDGYGSIEAFADINLSLSSGAHDNISIYNVANLNLAGWGSTNTLEIENFKDGTINIDENMANTFAFTSVEANTTTEIINKSNLATSITIDNLSLKDANSYFSIKPHLEGGLEDGFDGDDTIHIKNISSDVTGGTGSIYINAGTSTAVGGIGDGNKITIDKINTTHALTIAGGANNDHISIGTNGETNKLANTTIDMGAGWDTFTLQGNTQLDDLLTINAGSDGTDGEAIINLIGTISGSGGIKINTQSYGTIDLQSSAGALEIDTHQGGIIKFNGTDSSPISFDSLNIESHGDSTNIAVYNTLIANGDSTIAGSNTITMYGNSEIDINGILSTVSTDKPFGSALTIASDSAGSNTINIDSIDADAANVNIDTGSSDDVINLGSVTATSLTINTNDGNDTIILGSVTGTNPVVNIDTGLGNDFVRFDSALGANLDAGNDVMVLAHNDAVSGDAGDGNDLLISAGNNDIYSSFGFEYFMHYEGNSENLKFASLEDMFTKLNITELTDTEIKISGADDDGWEMDSSGATATYTMDYLDGTITLYNTPGAGNGIVTLV